MSSTLPLKRIWTYFKPYTALFYSSVTCSVLNKIFDLMPPLLVGWIIDSVRGEAPVWIRTLTHTTDPFSMAIFLSVLAVGIFLFESIFQWGYQYGFMSLAQRIQHDLRMDVYSHLQNKEMIFFENHRLGDTLSIVSDDINQLERFLNNGLNELLQLAVLLVVSSSILFVISWQLAIIGMIPIPIIILGSLTYRKWLSPRYKQVREQAGSLTSRLENNIAGIGVIKSFTAEKLEYQRVEKASKAYLKANGWVIRLSSSYTPIIRMGVVLGFAGVLLVGSYWVLKGTGVLTVGQLVLFAMMTERLLWPLTRLGPTVDDLERASACTNRVLKILDEPLIIKDPEQPIKLDEVKGKIRLNKVSFSYENKLPVLNELSFTIKAGETLGIAGATGSGKSSLIKLLLRYYDPTQGTIELDDINIKNLKLSTLRKSIALVSQDVYLFHGTIFENIAYSTPLASLEKVIEASQQAQLHDFVMSLPDQYNTLVGEKGIKLSGGQRQRLSIARAILKNAPIMIFDEATSSVDTETEKAIQQHLNLLTKGKTAILIAHRLSTLRHTDRILVINNGILAEEGHHDTLIQQKGIYADLWKTQIGEF